MSRFTKRHSPDRSDLIGSIPLIDTDDQQKDKLSLTSFLPRNRRLAQFCVAMSLLSLPSTAASAQTNEKPPVESPSGLVLQGIVAQRSTESQDPNLEANILYGFNSFSDMAENMLATAKPQGISEIKTKRAGRKITVQVENMDSESAFLLPSQNYVSDINGHPRNVPFVEQIDNDTLLTNKRRLRIFTVSKKSDWQYRSKWRKASTQVSPEEWVETNIDAPVPESLVGLNPNENFVSPLSHTSSSELLLTKKIPQNNFRLGLVALEVTRSWGERNDADGERDGYVRFLYPITAQKEGTIKAGTLNFLSYLYKDRVEFQYSTRPPEESTARQRGAAVTAKPRKR